MNKELKQELSLLSEELRRRKESVQSFRELLNDEPDREYRIDLWELSERELDAEMGDRLTLLNDDINIRPDIGQEAVSPRRFIGRFITPVKRKILDIVRQYVESMASKSIRFNEQATLYHLASFIRFRHNERRILVLEQKLRDMEEQRELLLHRLQQLEKNLPAHPAFGATEEQ